MTTRQARRCRGSRPVKPQVAGTRRVVAPYKFRRVNGHLHLPELRDALTAHLSETGLPDRHNDTVNA